MVRWLIGSICIPLALVGCSAETGARWHADKRFTAAERVEIVRGAEWLSQASGHDVGGVDFDYEVTSEQPLAHTIRRERGSMTERGETGLCQGDTVYLDPVGLPDEGMRIEFLAGLTAHELGHCELGLADDLDSDGIMHNITGLVWSEREEAQCKASPKCRPTP
jgi:hypothetical protein